MVDALMGKTHEDSVRELAEKTPYTVGEVHDTILKFKKPLMIMLALAGRGVEEPTEGRCKHPNAKLMCRWRDEFFRRNKYGGYRNAALRAVINFVIILYEYDAPYRRRINWFLYCFLGAFDAGSFSIDEQPIRDWRD